MVRRACQTLHNAKLCTIPLALCVSGGQCGETRMGVDSEVCCQSASCALSVFGLARHEEHDTSMCNVDLRTAYLSRCVSS